MGWGGAGVWTIGLEGGGGSGGIWTIGLGWGGMGGLEDRLWGVGGGLDDSPRGGGGVNGWKSLEERSISFMAPSVWNSLPAALGNVPTLIVSVQISPQNLPVCPSFPAELCLK